MTPSMRFHQEMSATGGPSMDHLDALAASFYNEYDSHSDASHTEDRKVRCRLLSVTGKGETLILNSLYGSALYTGSTRKRPVSEIRSSASQLSRKRLT